MAKVGIFIKNVVQSAPLLHYCNSLRIGGNKNLIFTCFKNICGYFCAVIKLKYKVVTGYRISSTVFAFSNIVT